MGASGYVDLDFGAGGGCTASQAVTATGCTAGSVAEAWIMGTDATAGTEGNNAPNHRLIAAYAAASISAIGTDSLTVTVVSRITVRGTLRVRWVWY